MEIWDICWCGMASLDTVFHTTKRFEAHSFINNNHDENFNCRRGTTQEIGRFGYLGRYQEVSSKLISKVAHAPPMFVCGIGIRLG